MPRKRQATKPPSLRERAYPTSTPEVRITPQDALLMESMEQPALELWVIARFIEDCDRNGLNREARSLRQRVRRLERARRNRDVDTAMVEALHLGRAQVSITRDTAFAQVVDAQIRSRRKPSVTDEQIRAEVAKHPTQAAAAGKLGIGERQLRQRLRSLGVKNRKSGRPPPPR